MEGVQKLCAAGIDVLELNISCPNVKQGGLAFGIRAKDAEEVVSAVRKVCTVPLVVKLSPQAESIPDMCKAVDKAMVITDVHLLSKAGGKSGDFVWKQASEA